MSDLRLITLRQPGVEPVPPQPGDPLRFFGEQSNDLQLNTVNDFETVSGVEKLKQEVLKILLTERGTQLNFPLYGTTIQSLVGSKVNFTTVQARIKDEVIGALQVLQFTNKNNPNLDEKPETLEFLSVELIAIDQVEIKLNVITESGKKIVQGFTLNP